MTDTEKLVIANLLAAIRDDRETREPYSFKLSEMEEARKAADERKAEAKAKLDSCMAAAGKLIG